VSTHARSNALTELPTTPWFPIQTQRLVLREFRADDYDGIHAYASDLETVRFMDWGPNTPEMSRARLDLMLKEQTVWPRGDVNLAVELAETAQLIGAARLSLDGQDGADLGYSYGSAFWRRGYGYEAAVALVTVGVQVLGLHRIWATCDVRNGGSIAILEKLGILHLIGDPEICWVNDAEIVGDGVSQMAPVSWDGVAKKREHGGGEFSEGSVAFVVSDVLMHQTP
jgi:RimJ/RimL family protein N-acetyltransferase